MAVIFSPSLSEEKLQWGTVSPLHDLTRDVGKGPRTINIKADRLKPGLM